MVRVRRLFCLGLAGGWISVLPGTGDPDLGAAAKRGVLGSLVLVPTLFVLAGIVVGYDGEGMAWLVMLSPFIGAGLAALLFVGSVVGSMSHPILDGLRSG